MCRFELDLAIWKNINKGWYIIWYIIQLKLFFNSLFTISSHHCCLFHMSMSTYTSSSPSSSTSRASTTISIFNHLLSFIRTHVWCKHSNLDTLDVVFGGVFVQLKVIGLLCMHLQCGDWLYVLLYVFRPMEQWWFELVVWIVWKIVIVTYNHTFLHMAIFKGVMQKNSRTIFVALKCNMLLKTWVSFSYCTKLNLWFSRHFTNNMSLLNYVFVEFNNGVIKFGLVGNVVGTISTFNLGQKKSFWLAKFKLFMGFV